MCIEWIDKVVWFGCRRGVDNKEKLSFFFFFCKKIFTSNNIFAQSKIKL